jgi:hypothetical protein
VEACHAGATPAAASGVKSAPRFAFDEVGEEAVERRLEHCLQAAEDEVATGRGVDHEAKVVGNEVFGEAIALDTGERGEPADGAMGVGVH